MNIDYCKLFLNVGIDFFDICEVVDVIELGVYVKLFYMLCVLVENLVCKCDFVMLNDLFK